MSEKAKKEINSFKEKVKKEAEDLIFKKFPQKILDLDVLSNSSQFGLKSGLVPIELNIPIPDHKSNVSSITQTANKREVMVDFDDELIIAKPFLFPNGPIDCNKTFIDMIDILKPSMIQLTEDLLLLKLGISLMVPKIEDGNNFGVEVQQETIEAIGAVESDVINKFQRFETYFDLRGDLVIKVAKYPHNQDFRIAVKECDQKFHLNLCLALTDIRNHYVNLHDLVTKNINKIKEPRSQDNKDFLY